MARNSVGERKWVKDSQHFSAELRDFRGVVEANSHQMHYYPGSRTITGWREEERPKRLQMKAVRCRHPHAYPA